jgi:hypothetical protein
MLPADKDIRTAIAALIIPVAPQALVIPRLLMDVEVAQWAAVYRSDAHDGLIHAWCVSRLGAQPLEIGNRPRDYRWTYRVTGFRQYETGTAAANSEDEFSAEIDLVAEAIRNSKHLGFSSGVHSHDELQFPAAHIDIRRFGSSLVHLADGRLTVRVSNFC